jgi:polysaccharide biosynthesis transport protein
MSSANLAEKLINAAQLIITSEDVLMAALRKIGVEKVYDGIVEEATRSKTPAIKLAADRLGKDIAVSVNINTNVLRLSLFNVEPAVAQSALQALIAATVEKQASVMRDPRLKFLETKLAALKKEADQTQQAVLAFRQRTKITAFYEERSLLLKQRDETQLRLSQSQADLVATEGRAHAIGKSLRKTPERIELSNENDSMQRQLDDAQGRVAAAQARYEAARQRFAEGNPELIDQRLQMTSASSSLRSLKRRPTARRRFGQNPLHQNLTEELAKASSDAKAHTQAIKERKLQLDQINERLGYLDSQELTMRELEHRRESVDQDYRAYMQRVQSARIVTDMNLAGITSLSVLQPPTLPYETARPRKLLLFVLALLAGLVGAVAICLLMERYDETVARPEDVEAAVGLPLLGAVNLQRTR